MFTLDKSLLGIMAAEMDVTEVYRSTIPQSVAVEGLSSSPCEAFACSIKNAGSDQTDIYVMLRFPSEKYSLVYRPDRKVLTQADYAEVMKDAQEFLGSLGFVLEPVNLNYSRAMREVVIRSLRLLSAPGSLDGMCHPLSDKPEKIRARGKAPTPAAPGGRQEPPAAAEQEVKLPESFAAANGGELEDELRNEIARLAGELVKQKRSHEKEHAAIAAARDKALTDHAALQKKIDAVTAELSSVRKTHEDEMASLIREREQGGVSSEAYTRLEHELYEAEGEKERLSAELAAMEKAYMQELDELRKELKRHAVEKEKMRQTLTAECDGLQSKLNNLAAEKQAVETTMGEQLAAARSAAESRSVEFEALRAGQEKELSGLADEWERLLMEKSAEHDRISGELAKTRAEAELLRSTQVSADEMEELRKELAKAVADRAATEKSLKQMLAVVEEEERKRTADQAALQEAYDAERSRHNDEMVQQATKLQEATAALASVQAELARLTTEKSAAEQSMSQTISLLEEEVELLSAEKAALAEGHAVEMAGLRSRLKRSASGTGVLDAGVAAEVAPPVPVPAPSETRRGRQLPGEMPAERASEPVKKEIEERKPEPAASALLSRPKRRAAPADATEEEALVDAVGSDGMFHVSSRLKGIEVNEGDDLVELHQSINVLNVAAEGYPMQKSSSYVCAIRKGGAVRVYIALYLTESKAVQVYVTAGGKKIPPWEEALREAILFTETIGFMMDRVEFGSSPEEYEPLLAGIPVFIF